MRTANREDSISDALFGRVRQRILALLFTHSDESYYVRQIARIAGCGLGAVHRELNNLVRAGLAIRTDQGKQVYYQANKASPVFVDLRGLIVKTAGIVDVLRSALAPLADRIDSAFVYGSMAHGGENSESDVDVLIIGKVGFGEAVQVLRAAEQELRREVNPSVFALEEFRERVRDREHFIASVTKDDKIFLIGDEHEFERAAGTRPA